LKVLKNAPVPEVISDQQPTKQEEGWTSWAISAVKTGISKSDTIEPKKVIPITNSSTMANTTTAKQDQILHSSKTVYNDARSISTTRANTSRTPMTLKKNVPSSDSWTDDTTELPKPTFPTQNQGWANGWDDDWKEDTKTPLVKKESISKAKESTDASWKDSGWGSDDWATSSRPLTKEERERERQRRKEEREARRLNK
jgi:hypothetical protein